MIQAEHPRRILVVDDYEDAAAVVAAILQLHGHHTRFAVGGHAGLCVASTFSPEIVYLDLSMPGFDGYKVARCLRLTYPDRNLRLIALTASGDDISRARAKAAGFDVHLVKPAHLNDIIASANGEEVAAVHR